MWLSRFLWNKSSGKVAVAAATTTSFIQPTFTVACHWLRHLLAALVSNTVQYTPSSVTNSKQTLSFNMSFTCRNRLWKVAPPNIRTTLAECGTPYRTAIHYTSTIHLIESIGLNSSRWFLPKKNCFQKEEEKNKTFFSLPTRAAAAAALERPSVYVNPH